MEFLLETEGVAREQRRERQEAERSRPGRRPGRCGQAATFASTFLGSKQVSKPPPPLRNSMTSSAAPVRLQ